jgi:hypothetical protein
MPAVLLSALMTASAAWAAPPTPFVMTTYIIFPEGSGTFTIEEPDWICPTGVFENVSEIANPPVAGAFTVTAVVEYTCDDGSGTFHIQAHPQGNPGNFDNDFAVSGPWSILPGGTGAYEKLRGHGEMGFSFLTFDPETGEVTGNETYAGLVSQND